MNAEIGINLMKFIKLTKEYTQHVYTGYSFVELLIWKIATLRRFLSQERQTFSISNLHKLYATWKIKGTFSGPALIAATGPSFSEIPIEVLQYFRTINSLIAVNLYLLTPAGMTVAPNFQVITDRRPWTDFESKNFNDFRSAAKKLIDSSEISFLIQPYNHPDLFANQKSIYIHKNPLPGIVKYKGVLGPSGLPNYTTFFAIAAALHLGFSPIYITGLDLNHFLYLNSNSNSTLNLGNHHAYEEDERQKTWSNRNSVEDVLSSSIFQMHYLKNFSNREIFILGEGSMVDVLKKITITELMEQYSIKFH
jgi:hypothetical protein